MANQVFPGLPPMVAARVRQTGRPFRCRTHTCMPMGEHTPPRAHAQRRCYCPAPMSPGTEFQGGLFSDAVSGKRAGATIRLGFDAIEATTAAGQRFSLPYAQCELERGGASERMIFCHAPDRSLTIFTEEKTFLAALSHAGGVQIATQLARLTEEAARASAKTRQWVLVGLLLLALSGYGAWHGLGVASSHAVEALPISVDQKIGELAMESMPLQGKRVDDPVLVKAVDEIVGRLKPHAGEKGMDFDVTIVDAAIVNAYCLPGGKIVLYTGLLNAAESPEQVAGVLAHEMAHATERHGLKRIANSIGIVVGVNLLLGDVSGLVAFAVELAQHGLLTSHGREQETESDVEAVRMMSQAGLSPAALAEFFAILEKEHGDVPSALSWLSSHPQLAERQKEIRARTDKLGKIELRPLALDWEQVSLHAKKPGAGLTLDAKP